MILFIQHLLSFLIAYFIGLMVFEKLNTYKRNDYIIQRVHSFFLGIGLTSFLFWFFTVLTNGKNNTYPLFELFIVAFLFIKFRKTNIKSFSLKDFKKNQLFTIQNLITLLLFSLIFTYIYFYSSILPNGTCDAFYMFNYKAKYLAYEKPEMWYGIFSQHLADFHPDYPLFLSCTIARLFIYSGGYNDISPAIFTIIIAFSVFLLLYLYLYKLKSWYYGIVALCVLSASEKFVFYSVWQCSDIPFAFYILISGYELILWFKDSNSEKSLPLIALFFSSVALWMKNEGTVFFILFIALTILYEIKKQIRIKNIFKSGIVLLPSFLSILIIRLIYTGSNDLMANLSAHLNGFCELYRYKYIVLYVFFFIYRNLWLVVIPLFIWRKNVSDKYVNIRLLLLIPCFAYLIYFSIYFITPYDFYWFIYDSFNRIMQHYIPLLLFLCLLLFSPEKLLNKNKK